MKGDLIMVHSVKQKVLSRNTWKNDSMPWFITKVPNIIFSILFNTAKRNYTLNLYLKYINFMHVKHAIKCF